MRAILDASLNVGVVLVPLGGFALLVRTQMREDQRRWHGHKEAE